jgi:ABC-type amino acid transport substrate-binding protein
LYYAFNPGTAPELIARMQRALDAIKEDGTYRDIVARYVK